MNQQAMLRKVRQLQQEMMAAQKEIEATEFTANVGVVEVVMMGNHELKSVNFTKDAQAEDAEDFSMLGDMIVAASHQANEEIAKYTEEKMSKYQSMLGGFGGF
jgi:DNA-binding protein YbaB